MCCNTCTAYCELADRHSPGVVGGAELTYLRAQGSILAYIGGAAFTPDMVRNFFHPETSARFWLGYATTEDTALRATYWRSTPDDRRNVGNELTELIEAQTFDLENIFTSYISNIAIHFTVGGRYANYSDTATIFYGSGSARDFEGAGASVGVWAEKPIGDQGLSVIGGIRGSYLFGNASYTSTNVRRPSESFRFERQHIAQIYDVKLGVQWSHVFTNNVRGFVRTGFENQNWNLSPIHRDLRDGNAGFIGGTLAFGFER